MKKIVGMMLLLLVCVASASAQEEKNEKLPPLLKEKRNGKVMFDADQARREISRMRLAESNAIWTKWGEKPCPVFAFKDTEGKEWTNENIRGKVTLINFWHVNCGPCIREMPWLNKLMEKHPQVNFLGCTFNTPAQIEKLVAQTPFLYPQLTDEAIGLWQAFGVELSPTTIILDKEGKVFAVVTGVSDVLKRTIEAKLKEANKE